MKFIDEEELLKKLKISRVILKKLKDKGLPSYQDNKYNLTEVQNWLEQGNAGDLMIDVILDQYIENKINEEVKFSKQ